MTFKLKVSDWSLHEISSIPFKEKSADHIMDLHKLKLLTNFDVNLTTFLGKVINYELNV